MKTRIIKSLNGLCVELPTEGATAIADKIDALQSCNVIEIRHYYKKGVSCIIVADYKESAVKDIETILSAY